MVSPLPYPWSLRGNSLALVLRDPELYPELFPRKRFHVFWDEVRSSAGDSSALPATGSWSIRVDDSRGFGKALLTLLPTERGRQRLAKRWHRGYREAPFNDFLAMQLASFTLAFNNLRSVTQLPRLKEVFQIEGSPSGELHPIRFLEAIAREPPGPEAARDLALLGCAVALLFPSQAVAIYERLASLSEELRALVSDPDVPPPTPALVPLAWEQTPLVSPSGPLVVHPTSFGGPFPGLWISPPIICGEPAGAPELGSLVAASASSVPAGPAAAWLPAASALAAPEKESLSQPAEVEQLLQLLDEGGDWGTTLPLEEHRRNVGLLQSLVRQNQQSLGVTLDLLARLAPSPDDPEEGRRCRLPADLAAREAMQRLGAGEREVRRLLEERRQFQVFLAERLGTPADREHARLAQLQGEVGELQAQREEIAGLPWLEDGPWPVTPFRLAAGETLAQAAGRLEAARQQAARILGAHQQLGELLNRLRQPLRPFVPGPVLPLDKVAECLERRLAEAEQQWRQTVEREQEAARFLDQLRAVGEREIGQRLFRETPPER